VSASGSGGGSGSRGEAKRSSSSADADATVSSKRPKVVGQITVLPGGAKRAPVSPPPDSTMTLAQLLVAFRADDDGVSCTVDQCSWRGKTQRAFDGHVMRDHVMGTMGTTVFACQYPGCSQVYNDQDECATHARTHPPPTASLSLSADSRAARLEKAGAYHRGIRGGGRRVNVAASTVALLGGKDARGRPKKEDGIAGSSQADGPPPAGSRQRLPHVGPLAVSDDGLFPTVESIVDAVRYLPPLPNTRPTSFASFVAQPPVGSPSLLCIDDDVAVRPPLTTVPSADVALAEREKAIDSVLAASSAGRA